MLFLAVLALGHGLKSQQSNEDEKVVYDTDSRIEVYEAPAEYQLLTTRSIVALVKKSDLICIGGICRHSPFISNLGTSQNLCEDQLFREQPVLAYCSGTLVGQDRILTAGHCIPDQHSCDHTYFVFNYHYTSSDVFPPISFAHDVYECNRFFTEYSNNDGYQKDWSLVQLDRVVHSSHTPVSLSTLSHPIESSRYLMMIGYPGGIPAKVTSVTTTASAMWGFYGVADAFGGNSGSGVFDSDLKLVGVMVRGNTDYLLREGKQCRIVNVLDSDNIRATLTEQFSWANLAIEGNPECSHASDCPSSDCLIDEGLNGFCNEPVVSCGYAPCSRIFYGDCCFAGSEDGILGRCTACGLGDSCNSVSTSHNCLSCEVGYELEVLNADCSGRCVQTGTVPDSRKPSEEECPLLVPFPDCSICGDSRGSNDDPPTDMTWAWLSAGIATFIVLFICLVCSGVELCCTR
eukprot:c4576_g1_i1.p1 GENE.c4576_g1_i1~~c4576_g1_i1.p1  ORF type:complete len:460 (-),score=75.98 c4576_g1_i1:22-1401(-)